jgi:hypothetical protein
MAKTKKKKIEEPVPQEMICEMCGTKFIGTGGVCSTECADAWVKTYIDGPWKREGGQ